MEVPAQPPSQGGELEERPVTASAVTSPAIEAFRQLDLPDSVDECFQIIQAVLSDWARIDRETREAGAEFTDPQQHLWAEILYKIITISEKQLQHATMEVECMCKGCFKHDPGCKAQNLLNKNVDERLAELFKLLGFDAPPYFVTVFCVLEHLGPLYEKHKLFKEDESIFRSCVICSESTYVLATYKCRGTYGLVYCRNCLKQHFEAAMKEYLYPPKCCPGNICYSMDEVEFLFDHEFVEKFREKEMEFKIDMEDRVYCSRKDCISFIPPRNISPDGIATCEKCKSLTCAKCKLEAHPLLESCPEIEDSSGTVAFEQYAEENEWKKCPDCQTFTERVDGCDHILCENCGANWCYNCGMVDCFCHFDDDEFEDEDRGLNDLRVLRVWIAERAAERAANPDRSPRLLIHPPSLPTAPSERMQQPSQDTNQVYPQGPEMSPNLGIDQQPRQLMNEYDQNTYHNQQSIASADKGNGFYSDSVGLNESAFSGSSVETPDVDMDRQVSIAGDEGTQLSADWMTSNESYTNTASIKDSNGGMDTNMGMKASSSAGSIRAVPSNDDVPLSRDLEEQNDIVPAYTAMDDAGEMADLGNVKEIEDGRANHVAELSSSMEERKAASGSFFLSFGKY